MIRYINISQFACDLTFGCFMLSWVITRHIFFLSVIHSLIFTAPRLIDMQWTPEAGYYFDQKAYIMFSGLLLSLQVCPQLLLFSFQTDENSRYYNAFGSG